LTTSLCRAIHRIEQAVFNGNIYAYGLAGKLKRYFNETHTSYIAHFLCYFLVGSQFFERTRRSNRLIVFNNTFQVKG